jgi:hypothetical protein
MKAAIGRFSLFWVPACAGMMVKRERVTGRRTAGRLPFGSSPNSGRHAALLADPGVRRLAVTREPGLAPEPQRLRPALSRHRWGFASLHHQPTLAQRCGLPRKSTKNLPFLSPEN